MTKVFLIHPVYRERESSVSRSCFVDQSLYCEGD